MNLQEQIYRIKEMMGISESVSDIKNILHIGSEGDEVSQLQKILDIYEDGKFGPQTQKCVKEFQRIEPKIEDDGIVGNDTIEKLKKLERGEITWTSPDFCKSSPKFIYEPITPISSDTEKKPEIKNEKGDGFEIILMGGLDYRGGDKTISQQVESLKNATGNKNVIGFRYNAPSEVKSAIQQNENAYVVLFSAGCSYASDMATIIKNKNKLFIVEPYASSTKVKQSVRDAVFQGVPSRNVITGPNVARGSGVVENSTSTPNGMGHWGALEYVAKFLN